jgi:hypothetical protein
MANRLALSLLLSACHGRSPAIDARPVDARPRPDVAPVEAEPLVVTTPDAPAPAPPPGPPRLACEDEACSSYTSAGLPAVTADGRVVVTGSGVSTDFPEGPSFRIADLDVASDRELEVHRITRPYTAQKLAQANVRLARRGLVPLAAYPRSCEDDGPECSDLAHEEMPIVARVGPLRVEYAPRHLHLTRGKDVVGDRDVPGWSVPDREIPGSGVVCRNPAYLAGVWADLARGVLVLRVQYLGNDTCPPPPPVDHALPIP